MLDGISRLASPAAWRATSALSENRDGRGSEPPEPPGGAPLNVIGFIVQPIRRQQPSLPNPSGSGTFSKLAIRGRQLA